MALTRGEMEQVEALANMAPQSMKIEFENLRHKHGFTVAIASIFRKLDGAGQISMGQVFLAYAIMQSQPMELKEIKPGDD